MVQIEFQEIGHAHKEQDQRFSVAASILSKQSRLENLEAFLDCLKNNLKPVRNRQLHVKITPQTMNFQAP
eukprot:12390100-Alexandrium_andersonii.AAC.1